MKSVLLLFCAACNLAPARAHVLAVGEDTGLRGDAVDARAGDILIRSSQLIAVIQRPQRDAGPAPFGGNLIDLALADDRIDRFGETMPLVHLGRTARFDRVDVLRDGSDGEAVVVEARGGDALWDFVNIPAVVPDILFYRPDNTGLLRFDANESLHANLRARYELGPDDDFLTITYTIERNTPLDTLAGVAFDLGGAIQFFQHGPGFAAISDFDSSFLTAIGKPTDFFALVGSDVAYGLRPVGSPAVGFSAGGVTVVVPSTTDALSTLLKPNLSVAPSGSYAVEVQVGRSLADVRGRFLARDGDAMGHVLGRFNGDTRLLPPVALVGVAGDVDATIETSAEQFVFHASPGTYVLKVDAPGFPPLTSAPFVVAAGETVEPTLELPQAASIVIDGSFFDLPNDAQPTTARACRVSVFHALAPHGRTAYSTRERNKQTEVERQLLGCSGELLVPYGTYLVQVSAGPLRDVHRQVVRLEPAERIEITPMLHRIVDAPGVWSADFHQHSVGSPDSAVPLEDRVRSYAAEGIDFVATSDHDRIVDYAPTIAALGLADVLAQAPGVETTTFAYGHFNAWPLPVDPNLPSGGAIDWTVEATSLLPRDIFKAFRLRGAGIVQVNHPRLSTSLTDFHAFFDRAGLVVDPDRGILGSDPMLQSVSNELLRLPPGEPLFDDNFDALELLNGFAFGDEDKDGRLEEVHAEDVLRDYLGMVAMGFFPTLVGVSDSHVLYQEMAGYPRTYVWANTPGSEAVQAALKARRALASNGPLLEATLIGRDGAQATIGGMAPVDDVAYVRVQVQAQTAKAIDRVDLFVNTWMQHQGGFKRAQEPLLPTVSVDVALQPVTRANGGIVYTALATIPINVSKDAFVIVRASGVEPLFPFLPGQGQGTAHADAATPQAFFTEVSGAPAIAVSNPIFLDRDHDGRWTPPRIRLH